MRLFFAQATTGYAGEREKLKTSDLLDDIVMSGAISKATINLLVEKIIIHRVDDQTIDVHFLMKGAFKNTISTYMKP